MTTESLFSISFLVAERELGERIGYPALVYDAPQRAAMGDDAGDVRGDLDRLETPIDTYGTVEALRAQLHAGRVMTERAVQQIQILREQLDQAHQHIAQGEQLVGEGIALVDKLTDALRYVLETGEWVWSEADKANVFTIHLAASTVNEFENLLEAV
jgi:hypothetical protein